MYRHIFWDFDGTLYDTYPVMAGAFCAALNEYGVIAEYGDVYAHMKISMRTAIDRFLSEGARRDDILSRYAELSLNCAPYTGIPELLDDIVARGGRNYVLTHRGKSLFPMLDKHGLTRKFTDFVTGDMGFERKPSPEGLLWLIDKHSVPISDAIIVGDRELDLLAGINAGVECCAFCDGTAAEPAIARLIAHSVVELRGILGY